MFIFIYLTYLQAQNLYEERNITTSCAPLPYDGEHTYIIYLKKKKATKIQKIEYNTRAINNDVESECEHLKKKKQIY